MKLKKVLAVILAVAMLLTFANTMVFAEGETVFVAAIGDNYFKTIADAIAAANSGDVVAVLSDLTLESTITVPEDVTLDGGLNTITAKGSPAIILRNGATIQNATVIGQGSNNGISCGNDVIVNNCDISIFSIAVYMDNGATITNNNIHHSFSCLSGWGPIHASDNDLVIRNNTLSNATYGIHFDQKYTNAVIEGNKIYGLWNSGNFDYVKSFKNNIFYSIPDDYNRIRFNSLPDGVLDFSNTFIIGENCTEPYTVNPQGSVGVLDMSGMQYELTLAFDFDGDMTTKNVVLPENVIFSRVEDDIYYISEAEATVIETAKTTNASIELTDLATQDSVDVDEDATYKVVVATAPADDTQKANDTIAANGEADKEKAIFDISVLKTDSNGTSTDISGTITKQKVTLTLGETPETDSVSVYHVDNSNNTVDPISGVVVNGNAVTFTAPSFSTYAVTYTAAAVDDDAITKEIEVAFEEAAEGEYDIVLRAADGLKINRFMSATIAFALDAANIAYEIEPAANITVEEVKENVFRFNMDGINAAYASGTAINIGKVYFTGYGHLEFKVDNTKTFDGANDIAVNIVNTAKAADNIVDKYTPLGDASATPAIPELKINDGVTNNEGVIDTTLAKNTKNLTINVKFNNIISDNKATYQDMKVTVSGGDLTSPIVKNFGSEGGIALNGDTYTVKIADTLTKNVGYTVKVEGAGYRTARHIVTMTENKVLNFWNNVKDSANATAIETGKTAMTKNFLAGDIVKDNNINIYDLSAVVSYFGTENLVSAHSEYAKYDLNRDGVIDSKDVAYVLVSWGE